MLTIISEPWNYEPWSGAVSTYNELIMRGLFDNFCEALEDCYPDGLTMTELNDILWFEPEFCYELVGLNYDSEKDEIIE